MPLPFKALSMIGVHVPLTEPLKLGPVLLVLDILDSSEFHSYPERHRSGTNASSVS